MKKLAIFDIDGVIYDGHVIFNSIQDQEKLGLISTGLWSKILSLLDSYQKNKKNYKQVADEMLTEYAKYLKGKKYQDLVDHNYELFIKDKNKFFPYFGNLLIKLNEKYDIYFVTTNFQFTTEAVSKIFGVKNYLSSIAEVKNGIFTGKVGLSLSGNKGIVSTLIDRYGKSGSFAVGDSENDADMLDKVEFPYVMEPNEKLLNISKNKKWKIVNRDTIADIIIAHAK